MDNPMLYCSPQIFAQRKNSRKSMTPLATGVLLMYNKGFFLITAKHVFDESKTQELFIPLNDRLLLIGGKWKYFVPNRNYDSIDLAILRIDEKLIDLILSKYKFIMKEVISEIHNESNNDYFIIMGFPAKRTTRIGSDFITKPFAFITQKIVLKRINKISLNEDDNITVRYSRNEQSFIDSDFKSQGPRDLRGISGCGLWRFTNQERVDNTFDLSLAGIVIEADINRGIICATRAKWILQLLEQGFV